MNRAYVAAIALLVASTVLLGAPSPESADAVTLKSRKLAPGVRYRAIRDPSGPWRIHVVSVKLSRRSTMDVALATDVLPGWEKVSSMAKRHGAVAAINADFATRGGRPVHTFAEDGHLVQTSLAWGLSFSANAAEMRAKVSHPSERVRLVNAEGKESRIKRVNAGPPGRRQLALFTRFGSWLEQPPKKACSARIHRSTRYGFRFERKYTRAKYRVGKVVCRRRALERKAGAVLSARRHGKKARVVRRLDRGDRVFVDWTLGRKGVLDTMGGNTMLVRNGRNVAPKGSGYPYTRNPRTGVGKTSNGKVLLVTVDGRQPGYSVGMTFREFARLFKRLGATSAMNLDGGGGTTMVVNGEVKNRPSAGRERPAPNALLVLPRRDRGEKAAKASGTSAPEAPRQPSEKLLQEIVHDPASTGGLVTVLQDQGAKLSPELERIAAEFRRHQRRVADGANEAQS
jgi:Phosphodiester glycosidase